ncbi:hypothetical protein niasHT_017048 [Heterodera trifolii]|uniref:Uncharacterized protein n=1 Tax=Heterodera trifolii TaxID=157864 RepID=A0ABD2KYA1_9BILA
MGGGLTNRKTTAIGKAKQTKSETTISQIGANQQNSLGIWDKVPIGDSESVFLLGTAQGGVYLFEPLANQLIRIFQVINSPVRCVPSIYFQADSDIKQLVDMPGRVHFLAITESMMFYQLAIEGKH